MATIHLPVDFREFLQSLNANKVEYLLVGGYAVGYHGYPRATADMDIWVANEPRNTEQILAALEQMGFGAGGELGGEHLEKPGHVIRLGHPPLRIEIHTSLSGVSFEACFSRRIVCDFDAVPVPVISKDDLKRNKRAAGRLKDLADLDSLPA